MPHQSNVPLIDHADVKGVYSQLAAEVGRREADLLEDLPVDDAHGLDACIEGVTETWVSGARTIRTVPALNALAVHLDRPISEDVVRILAGLDAKVNALDDLIDTERLSTREKVDHCVITAFSSVFSLTHCPADHVESLRAIEYGYFTEISQIPRIEHAMLERIRTAETDEERLDAMLGSYRYRARDIKAFGRIPATIYDVDKGSTDELLAALQAFRARFLLFEDFRHIERNLREGHESPVLCLFDVYDDSMEVVTLINELYRKLSYPTDAAYVDVLRDMERRPRDLKRVVVDSMRFINN